jgi:hypothetical protein
MKISKSVLACFAVIVPLAPQFSTQAHAGIVLSVEAAGAQTSTVPDVITQTFNSFSPGDYSSLTTNVGTLSSSGEFAIVPADVFGGAGGVGNYFSVGAQSGSASPVTLTLDGPQSYFGMWWSAADVNNTLRFYSGSTLLATYTTASVFTGIPGSYFGNPNNGGDAGEPFAYLNFNGSLGTTFTSVVFSNSDSTGTGFESDNWSVHAVPEPSSLVLCGTSAAIVGLGLWRRRRKVAKMPAITA